MAHPRLVLIFFGLCWLSACSAGSTATTSQLTASRSAEAGPVSAVQQAEPVPTPRLTGRLSEPHKQATLRKSFSDCNERSEGITVNMMNCMDDEIAYQDARLNNAYKRLHKTMPADKWIALRDERRKWLSNEERDCSPDSDSEEVASGTGNALSYKMCVLNRIAVRADELEPRLEKQ